MNGNENESAFVEQLTELQLVLRIYVQSLLPGDSAAHDVTQQANSTIWRKRGDFEIGTNFKAWAFSIARYEVLNHRKQQARTARFGFSEELNDTIAEEMTTRTSDMELRHEALRGCLEGLKSKDRELLLHRYNSSATLKDYSARTGRSVGGLKVTLYRLRSVLLDCISNRLQTEEGRV
ncbi:MAG: sigma-70 family RNA polymerase sigma factor [Opitutaceae bacterium]|jgi:RNA polymerase sigma-70 factor, ECF subfamily|nr:sigma-70 family RNA polymerase sigma factor [Opitutaceae bacterium]